jgi:preprotein translocase SecE subunit
VANSIADNDSLKNSSGSSGPLGYFSESLGELKKVTTPTRQEAMQASLVTLVIIAFMSVSLFVMDLLFHWVVSLLVL